MAGVGQEVGLSESKVLSLGRKAILAALALARGGAEPMGLSWVLTGGLSGN